MGPKFIQHDGGRKAAGFKGQAGDCVVRAAAIVLERPYKEIHDAYSEWLGYNADNPHGSENEHFNSRRFLQGLGFVWVPLMKVGSGCKTHLRAEELPSGRIIARVSHHVVAVIDGVIHDNYDCSRNGTRCVYGYYIMERNHG